MLTPKNETAIENDLVRYEQALHWHVDKKHLYKDIEEKKAHRIEHFNLRKIYRNCSSIVWKQRLTLAYAIYRDTLQGEFKNQWLTFLNHPDIYFNDAVHYLKKGDSSTLIQTHIGTLDVVIKRYNLKNPWHAFLRLWQPSRASRNWYYIHWLIQLNISTLTPVTFIEKRFGFLRKQAYLVTLAIDAEPLLHVLPLASEVEQDNLISQLIDILKKLRAAHLVHRDLKATNFLVEKISRKVYLIDLDGMHHVSFQYILQRKFKKDIQRLLANWQQDTHLQQKLCLALQRNGWM